MKTQGFFVALVALLGLLTFSVGCGRSGSPPTSSVASHPAPAPCRVGRSVLPHVPDASSLWKEGPGDPLALACLRDPRYEGAAIVGYLSPGAGSCIATYNPRFKEGIETLCRTGAESWTSQCEGEPGCIHSFVNGVDFTEFDGPLETRVKGIRIAVDGRPFRKGVTVARVEGDLRRSLRAKESFGYFAVFLHKCVGPNQVKMEFLGAGGSVLATTRGWDVIVPPCKGAGKGSKAG
jgi:hypothetical protein